MRRALRAAEVAAATPADRDRFIDLLRVASLLVVVAGHWLMATVVVGGGTVTGGNALSALPELRPVTWVLQVMPLFFVAGGFANLTVWRSVRRRGGGYAGYLYGRLLRLLRPTLVFVIVTYLLLAAARTIGLGKHEVDLVGRLLGQPLWFLGAYVAATAAAPALAAWHARSPVGAAGTLLVGAVLVDVVRLAGVDSVGYLNLALVWLFAQQVGFWYADGRLARLPPRVLWTVVGGTVAVLLALTGLGPYPVSMVGLPGEVSNMSPPTVCLLVLTVGQAAAAMLARPRVAAWLIRPAPWWVVVTVGSAAMTVYLWHLAVLAAGFGVILGLDVEPPEPGTGWWWATRPAWLVVLGVALVAVVAALSRLEGRGSDRQPSGARSCRGRTAASALGAAAAVYGLLGYVASGLAPSEPWSSSLLSIPVDAASNTGFVVIGLGLAAGAAGRLPVRLPGHVS